MITDYSIKSFKLCVEGKEYFISFRNKLNGVEVVHVSVVDDKGIPHIIDFGYKNQFKTKKDYIEAVLISARCDIRRVVRSVLRRLRLKQ